MSGSESMLQCGLQGQRFESKVVVVTGGSAGMGLCTARLLRAEGANGPGGSCSEDQSCQCAAVAGHTPTLRTRCAACVDGCMSRVLHPCCAPVWCLLESACHAFLVPPLPGCVPGPRHAGSLSVLTVAADVSTQAGNEAMIKAISPSTARSTARSTACSLTLVRPTPPAAVATCLCVVPWHMRSSCEVVVWG